MGFVLGDLGTVHVTAACHGSSCNIMRSGCVVSLGGLIAAGGCKELILRVGSCCEAESCCM